MVDDFTYDVFLSHNSEDKPQVRRLADRLRDAGLRVWFDEWISQETIRWMNVTRYIEKRKDKKSRQIIFEGQKLDMEAVWKVRDQFFPPHGRGQEKTVGR